MGATRGSGELVRSRRMVVLAICCLSLLLVGLDITIVNVGLPMIRRDLRAGISGLQWIVDAFILLLAALMLTGGTLGDLYGRKRIFMIGIVIFTGGSLFCALAPSAHLRQVLGAPVARREMGFEAAAFAV